VATAVFKAVSILSIEATSVALLPPAVACIPPVYNIRPHYKEKVHSADIVMHSQTFLSIFCLSNMVLNLEIFKMQLVSVLMWKQILHGRLNKVDILLSFLFYFYFYTPFNIYYHFVLFPVSLLREGARAQTYETRYNCIE
jgi:hypothetical protein